MLCSPAEAVMRPAAPSDADHSPRNRPSSPRFSSSQPYPNVVWTRSALRHVSSASTSGCTSRSPSSRQARVSGTSTPTIRSIDFTWVGLRRSNRTPSGTWRSTSASRASRSATASAGVRGRGPTYPLIRASMAPRSIGRPSTVISAHSSSAADSACAVRPAMGRGPGPAPPEGEVGRPSARPATARCWRCGDLGEDRSPRGVALGRLGPAAVAPLGLEVAVVADGHGRVEVVVALVEQVDRARLRAGRRWAGRRAAPRCDRDRPATRRTAAGARRRHPSSARSARRRRRAGTPWPATTPPTVAPSSSSTACTTAAGSGVRTAQLPPPGSAKPTPADGRPTSPDARRAESAEGPRPGRSRRPGQLQPGAAGLRRRPAPRG